jgi:hypothetical protein
MRKKATKSKKKTAATADATERDSTPPENKKLKFIAREDAGKKPPKTVK